MSRGRSNTEGVQTKIVCDEDTNCDVCRYDYPGDHAGTTMQLISHDYISFGDYDNSCAVERANVRYLEEQNTVVHTDSEGYGYRKVWIADTPENRELLESLDSYPAFDDELVSQVESEIEDEYIKDNDDIWRATPEPLKSILDSLDIRTIDPEIYFEAKEAANAEFIVESGGIGYIDLDKLATDYNRILLEKKPWIKLIAETQVEPPTFPINYYESAVEMLQHRQAITQPMTQEEANQILQYAADLETLFIKSREVWS